MTLVRQRFTADCAVACLAMFLGRRYEEVARHCHGAELVGNGLTNFREQHIAGLFDVEIVFRDRSLVEWWRPAVLTVPSLNSATGQTHAVYWDGERIWDPNHGRPGVKAYSNQAALEVAIEGYQRKK